MPISLSDDSKLSCDLSTWFKDHHIINKNTASPTDVVFGKLVRGDQSSSVSMKIFADMTYLPSRMYNRFYDNYISQIEGLKYEVRVYRDIIDKIVSNHLSPNFVQYIGYGECPMSKVVTLGPQIRQGVYKNYKHISREYFGTIPMGILITHKAGGGLYPVESYHEWQHGKSDQDKLLVNFQIVYAVAVMQKFHLVHNDMHANNVLVVTLPRTTTFYFIYGDRVYKIQSRYVPYLFDWDFAFCGELGPNKRIDMDNYCTSINICNRFSTKTDLYIFFCSSGFQAPIGDLYKDPSTYKKEEEEIIPLPHQTFGKEFYKRGYIPYIEGDAKIAPVYKMSSGQLRKTFGDAWVDTYLPNATSAMFRVYKKSMILFSGYSCRPTVFSTMIPSPDDLLSGHIPSLFSNLIVPKETLHGVNPHSVYKFPMHGVKTKVSIYRDPTVPKTRYKIAGNPRFMTFKELNIKPSYSQLRMAEEKVVVQNTHPEYDNDLRKLIIEWIDALVYSGYSQLTFFMAHKLLLLYLSTIRGVLTKEDIQKMALVCFMVASEVYDKRKMSLQKAVEMGDGEYKITDIMDGAKYILKRFGKMIIPTVWQFIMLWKLDQPSIDSIQRVLVDSIVDDRYDRYKPSLLAIAAVKMINITAYEKIGRIGYTDRELIDCENFLYERW